MATQQTPHSTWHRLRRDYGPLLLVLLLLTVTRTSFANHYSVPSGSMEPTLMPGDRVLVDMRAYGLRVPFTDLALTAQSPPRRGDVAIFKSPRDGERLIKRVVAVAGDVVSLRDGRLTVNDVPLASSRWPAVETIGTREIPLNLDDGGGPDIAHLVVPPGKVLVLGDHRGDSADGRYFGLLDADALYARAVGVYWRRDEGPVWKSL